MSCEVYANSNEVACKAGSGKVIAAFPDVCLSPPSPPAGPLPIPYPDTSFAKDTKNGSKTVKIKKKEIMLKNKSFYKSSPLGDEAATRSFGSGVVSHSITGKTYFTMWSMDVKTEGNNVDRHIDITTSNHSGQMPPNEAVPMTNMGMMAPPPAEDKDKCPCCGQVPPHENQVDPDTGSQYDTVPEMDWYENIVKYYTDRRAQIPDYPNLPETVKQEITRKADEAEDALEKIKTAKAQQPPCPNFHDPSDEECGTHYDKTNPNPTSDEVKQKNQWKSTRREYINDAKARGVPGVTSKSKVNHMTAVDAGGCPNSSKNLILDEEISDPVCLEAEDAQTLIQNRKPNT